MLSHLSRRILRSQFGHRLVVRLLALYARFVIATSRWTYMTDEAEESLRSAPRPLFVVLWHNRIGLMPFGWRVPGFQLTVLISDHRDGRVVSGVLDAARVEHIRVPASALEERTQAGHDLHKAFAAREVRRASAAGRTISVVADGPTGPRFRVKPFVVDLARICKAEIVLVTYAVKRRRIARSWDRLIIPLPFNRGIFRASPHTYDARGLDEAGREALRQEIERDLRWFVDETDAMLGHEPVE